MAGVGFKETWALKDALSSGGGSQADDTSSATVTRVDETGRVWAHLAGGVNETPVEDVTTTVAAGDNITVRVRGGRVSTVGNLTSPAASVTYVGAEIAGVAEVADRAVDDAARASAAADSAEQSAQAAQESADTAQSAANAATYSLSDVERVVGTLNWIAEHGSYVNQAGQTFDSSKTYYTRSGTSPNYVYTVVADPDADDIADYYLLVVDESVQNYIASHLWMDDYGLNLSVDSANGYRIHQGTVDGNRPAGLYIIDGSGNIVQSTNVDGVSIGTPDSARTSITATGMTVTDANGVLAVDLGTANASTTSKVSIVGDATQISLVEWNDIVTLEAVESGEALAVYYTPYPNNVRGNRKKLTFTIGTSNTYTQSASSTYNREGYEISYNATNNTVSLSFAVPVSPQPWRFEWEIRAIYHDYNSPAFTFGSRLAESDVGAYSTAIGHNLTAQRAFQLVLGVYNEADTGGSSESDAGDYAVIVGNGTSDSNLSNAFTLDWSGNGAFSGTINAADMNITAETVTTKSTLITEDACSISAITFTRIGRFAQLSFTFTPSSQIAVGDTLTIATLKAGYRPVQQSFGGNYYVVGAIGTSGVITVRNISGAAISTSRSSTFCATYILA